MLELVKRLLLQIKCAYCFKPLDQLSERRFGKVSLCDDCYNHITCGHSAVYSAESSTAFSNMKKQAVSNSKSGHFHNSTFFKKKEHFQNRKSGENLPLFLRLFYKPFRRDLDD